MADNNSNEEYNSITFFQSWLSSKKPMAIGTKFTISQLDKTITLIECAGYPKGKFVFEDGEDFDIGKYVDCKFIKVDSNVEKNDSTIDTTIYDESVWDNLDLEYNGVEINGEKAPLKIKNESTPLILKTMGSIQKNESFSESVYYDVSEIIGMFLEKNNKNNDKLSSEAFKKLYKLLMYKNYPFFTKEKLYILFSNCEFRNTKQPGIIRVIKNKQEIGYLVTESGKYIFAPKDKQLNEEYSFDNNNSVGFFNTAESYLDIALTSIDNYKNQFIPLYNSIDGKNNESFGYQADASIKTLLAFSCECYLKSLLINNGKNLSEIKNLGHGLAILYTALNDEQIGKVFSYMERNGYKISKYQMNYETNDLTEKFMLDLARVDDAFIDSRYSAENDKNTDYDFLFRFALALRNCSKKEFRINSPFEELIETKISKK